MDLVKSIWIKKKLKLIILNTISGYVEILTVPEGALNFRIEEMFEDPNYLALVDSKGDFILNGDYMIDWTGEYSVSGTRFYYDRYVFMIMIVEH